MTTRRISRACLSILGLAVATACDRRPADDASVGLRGGEVATETDATEGSEPEGAKDDGASLTEATPSTLVFDVPASEKTLSQFGIATWHLEVPSTGAGARIEGHDGADAVVRTVHLQIEGTQIGALLDGVRIASLAEAAAFDEIWSAVVRDTDLASASDDFAGGDLRRCAQAVKALANAVTNIAVMSTAPGAVALGIVVYLCEDCFLRNTDCGATPFPFSNSSCATARENTLGSIPACARALRDIHRFCRCDNSGFADVVPGGDQALGESCSDSPCDDICVGASGDVPVDRGTYGEVCHCEDPDPCEGSNDPCCGSNDPCCGSNDPCCGSWDECCGSDDPCCGSNDECCGDPDPCCGSWDECCGSSDPCCGSGDPCCGVICLDDDYCDGGECIHTDVTILCESPVDCEGAPCIDGHCSAEH